MQTKISWLIVAGVFLGFVCCCSAQQDSQPVGSVDSATEQTKKELSRFVQEAGKGQPYGGLEQALEQLDQMLVDEKYKEVVELSLLLMFRYWEDRLPLLQRCSRGLVGMDRWKDAIESLGLVATTASLGEEIRGATEFYYQDAITNLAVTQTQYLLKFGDSSVARPESIRAHCLQVLDEFPDEEFVLLAYYKGWRHPEAVLALGVACVENATAEIQSRELTLLEKLIQSTDGRKRINLRTERGWTYSFLALRQWWAFMERTNNLSADTAQSLERFAKRDVEDYTTPLAHALLGRLYSETLSDPNKAKQYYETALKMKLPPDDECWRGYHEECMDAVERLGGAQQ